MILEINDFSSRWRNIVSLVKINIDKAGFAKQMQAIQRHIETAFDSSLKEGADRMVSEGKSACKVPSLASTIQVDKSGSEYKVSAGKGLPDPDMAAWHEFGTGNPNTVKSGESAQDYVKRLTQDWRDYAATFIRNGQGSIPASPYLYPAFMRMKDNISNVIISRI